LASRQSAANVLKAMSTAINPAPASIKAYTRIGLELYDAVVMGVLGPRVWGCAAERLVAHYRTHLTANHADVGVGTGYCLDRCLGFGRPRLALIDLQPNCLNHASRRLSRFQPRCYHRDVLQPIRGIEGPAFDSIALGGVLHCLSGGLAAKGAVFDNLAPLVADGTRIFGYTLISDGVQRRVRTRFVHGLLNRARVIDNASDRLADLEAALSTRFVDCRVDLVGCMALFAAVVPARTPNPQRRPT
jgi:hypothetical protein